MLQSVQPVEIRGIVADVVDAIIFHGVKKRRTHPSSLRITGPAGIFPRRAPNEGIDSGTPPRCNAEADLDVAQGRVETVRGQLEFGKCVIFKDPSGPKQRTEITGRFAPGSAGLHLTLHTRRSKLGPAVNPKSDCPQSLTARDRNPWARPILTPLKLPGCHPSSASSF
jgi:hypothetical protein